MRKAFLGFDTSNYKTSAALYFPDDGRWQSEGSLLPVKEGELGLRQSDALFMHVKALPEIIKRLNNEDIEIIGVGYSDRPRPLPGSYMPCFLAGKALAESIASILNVPCHSFSHQQGHIASAAFSAGCFDMLSSPFYAWHLSGGTTELLKISQSNDFLSAEIVGGTSDISAGQLIDRVGVSLGLPFPAGPYVENAALSSNSDSFYKVKVQASTFSLSGMQNKIKALIESGGEKHDICSYTLNTVAYAVKKATEQALKTESLPVLVSGGVSACSFIKNALTCNTNIFFAQNGLGGDNALGAALLCAKTENCL